MEKPIIYTIGHSNHPVEYFLELLQAHQITCLVDVRSIPASRYNPQYNKARLKDFLKAHNIEYLHFGEEFGARQTNPEILNEEGRVDFEKVRQSPAFNSGIERLRKGIEKGYSIALMCAEAEPLNCHRFSMIAVDLVIKGFEVLHILKDKIVRTNTELEDELIKIFEKKLPIEDLFGRQLNRNEKLQAAFRLRNKEVGFKPEKGSK